MYSAAPSKECTTCEPARNCLTCTQTACLTCTAGNYMSTDKTTCDSSCSTGVKTKTATTYLHCVLNCVTDDDGYLNEVGD